MAFDNEIIDMYSEEEGNDIKIVLNNREVATLKYNGTIQYSSDSPFPIFVVRTQYDEKILKNIMLEAIFFNNLIPTPENIKSVAIQTEQIINKRLSALGLESFLENKNTNKLAIINAFKKPCNTMAFIDNLPKSPRNIFKHFGYSGKLI
ncbi:MAG: hypothetical protein LBG46_06610 [Elusimicrobiota bacterium]|nr:hypothetical protein [Elusimicrobiota bacterium]